MNRKMIWRIVGLSLCLEAGLMLLPVIAGLCFREKPVAYLLSAVVTGIVGFLLTRLKPNRETMYARDGFVAVALVWFAMSAFGALPFVLATVEFSFTRQSSMLRYLSTVSL